LPTVNNIAVAVRMPHNLQRHAYPKTFAHLAKNEGFPAVLVNALQLISVMPVVM